MTLRYSKLHLFILLLFLCIGCRNYVDFYSQVDPVCQYFVPGRYIENPTPTERSAITLKPACKRSLLKILPFDAEGQDTFKDAPAEMKDKIIEGFQVLYAYPIKIPKDHSIFGKAKNAFPLWFIETLRSEESPNKSLFNYVLNQIVNLRYDAKGSGSHMAEYGIDRSIDGEISIFSSILDSQNKEWFYTGAIGRAAVLVHEARHGDGIFHVPCSYGKHTRDCDDDLNGPIGAAAFYHLAILQGGLTDLSDADIQSAARKTCSSLKARIWNLPPDLEQLLNEIECSSLTSDWVRNLF